MRRLKIYTFAILILFFCAGCAPDLIVNKLDVTWDTGNKKAKAEIANVGMKDAGSFMVYFNGDEDPESPDYRPQVSKSVPGLAKGAVVALDADFEPLAHPKNNNLGNIYQITVLVDPKNMVKESNEKNNKMSVPTFKAESKFVFHPLSGNASVSGYGSQGPSGNNISFIIDLETGWTIFEDYTHVTFGASIFPPSINGKTMRLTNGVGRYDFSNGTFSNLLFVVQVEDPAGNITTSTHSFSGHTTAPLSVPAGSSPPTGVSLKLSLSPPFSIDLGGGIFGDIGIETSECVSATNL